jgi:hypothetical protein
MNRPPSPEHPADLARLYRPILWSWPIAVAKRSAAAVDDVTLRDEPYRLYIEITRHYKRWSEISLPLRKRGEAAETSAGDGGMEARVGQFRSFLVKAGKATDRQWSLSELCEACEGAKVSALRQIALRSNRQSARQTATEAKQLTEAAKESLRQLLQSSHHSLTMGPGTSETVRKALEALESDAGSGYVEYALADHRGRGSSGTGLFARRFLTSEFSRFGLDVDLVGLLWAALALPR